MTASANKKPTHSVSVYTGEYNGKKQYETIGAAWTTESGNLKVKLTGTQIVSGVMFINAYKESDNTPSQPE
jgi:hypothetical protein